MDETLLRMLAFLMQDYRNRTGLQSLTVSSQLLQRSDSLVLSQHWDQETETVTFSIRKKADGGYP